MRTNIDDDLMEAALQAALRKTKKATVEEALRLFVRTRAQGRLRELRGKLHWEGSLEDLRDDRRSSSIPRSGSATSTVRSRARPISSTSFSVLSRS